MKNKIEIMSRKAAEWLIRNGFPKNTAVISFYDPKSWRTPWDYRPVNYSAVCNRVLYVGVHDIDIGSLPVYGLTIETYLSQAEEAAEFILAAVNDGCNIICQCEYGYSRSAACAAAILEYYNSSGITIFSDYRYYPNQLIFNKILQALRKIGS